MIGEKPKSTQGYIDKAPVAYGWNNTRSDFGRLASGTALFESVVDQFPDIDAVRYGEETMTYRQLDRRANQLAGYLIKSGVKPDTVVGLCVERGPDMIIGLVGILKAGSAFLPIDPDNPAPRRAFMVEDAGIRIMVTQNRFASPFAAEQVKIVSLDADRELFVTQSPERASYQVSPHHMAYVIYTSGSTGKPKGVKPSSSRTGEFSNGAKGYICGQAWRSRAAIRFFQF
jgi:non-ribosomal peptide synthetase component F